MPVDQITGLWDTIKGWVDQNASQYLYVPIPKERTDANYSDAALQPYRSYFRLWLAEMFLAKSQQWFKTWHPTVHASVRLKFGDQNGVSFSHVARAPEGALSKGVLLNYPVIELIPFNGGIVEVEAGLLALQGPDSLGTAIGVLQDFSSLVVAPLGQALEIANKVSKAIQDLLGATNGRVHLSFHQAFTSAAGGGQNELKPGYVAVILASADQVAPAQLSVKNDRLQYRPRATDEPVPFQGYDYMLFRIEGRDERDNWRLRNIEEPLNKAIEALLAGESEKADAFKRMALLTAWQSPDLAVQDRRRVIQAIKEELAQIEATGLGAVAAETPDIDTIMASRAMPKEQAAALGEISLDEVFA